MGTTGILLGTAAIGQEDESSGAFRDGELPMPLVAFVVPRTLDGASG